MFYGFHLVFAPFSRFDVSVSVVNCLHLFLSSIRLGQIRRSERWCEQFNCFCAIAMFLFDLVQFIYL